MFKLNLFVFKNQILLVYILCRNTRKIITILLIMKKSNFRPNSQEFVLLSVEGYKKLSNIDSSCKNLYWTTDINTEIPIKYNLNDEKGLVSVTPKTLPQCLVENVKTHRDWPSMHAEVAKDEWTLWTWGDVWKISFNFAKSLLAFGVTHRSAVNIIGYNHPMWIFAFYGTIIADNVDGIKKAILL